jgi:hypothetical protein
MTYRIFLKQKRAVVRQGRVRAGVQQRAGGGRGGAGGPTGGRRVRRHGPGGAGRPHQPPPARGHGGLRHHGPIPARALRGRYAHHRVHRHQRAGLPGKEGARM